MNKELQDHVWKHCLPKEFKEEVKKEYKHQISIDNEQAYWMLERMFDKHNLTSGTEEDDEVLTVSRSKVQELYRKFKEDGSNTCLYAAATLDALFGSKCLPDEEPLFSNQPENYNNENLIVVSENKPTESTCTDDCPSPCPSQHFDNIINQSFADHNRLHIAAILAAGMLASEVRCYPVDRALELADKLIAECEKGDNNA